MTIFPFTISKVITKFILSGRETEPPSSGLFPSAHTGQAWGYTGAGIQKLNPGPPRWQEFIPLTCHYISQHLHHVGLGLRLSNMQHRHLTNGLKKCLPLFPTVWVSPIPFRSLTGRQHLTNSCFSSCFPRAVLSFSLPGPTALCGLLSFVRWQSLWPLYIEGSSPTGLSTCVGPKSLEFPHASRPLHSFCCAMGSFH